MKGINRLHRMPIWHAEDKESGGKVLDGYL